MAVSTVASVWELAAELLAKCDDVLATTVGGSPPSVFLSPGLPALDRQCDTLCVYEVAPTVQGASQSPTAGSSMRFAVVTSIGLNVQVARCIPVSREVAGTWKAPSDDQLTTAAHKVMEDGWALWNGVVSEVFAGDLFESHPCRGVYFDALTPLDPQGGMAGWTLSLSVDLDGYVVNV